MPLYRLITLLAVVIALAAITIAGVLAATGGLQTPSVLGLAIVSLLALCASLAVRRYAPDE